MATEQTNIFKSFQLAKEVAQQLSLQLNTHAEKGWCFQNRFDDEMCVEPLMLLRNGKAWLISNLMDLTEEDNQHAF